YHAPSVPRIFADLVLAMLAAAQVDELLGERIAHVMRHAWLKAHEVARPNFVLLAVDLGDPAPRQDVDPLLLIVGHVVDERLLARRHAIEVDPGAREARRQAEPHAANLRVRIPRMRRGLFARGNVGRAQQRGLLLVTHTRSL